MKIIADAMLGRLAKWLRILGIDVRYSPDITDSELIRIARQERRTILTRDREFTRRTLNVPLIFIKSNEVFGQLAELRGVLGFSAEVRTPRCPSCNGRVVRIAKDETLKAEVPDFVYHHFDFFTRCEGCGKAYWDGTHYRHVQETIGAICQR